MGVREEGGKKGKKAFIRQMRAVTLPSEAGGAKFEEGEERSGGPEGVGKTRVVEE